MSDVKDLVSEYHREKKIAEASLEGHDPRSAPSAAVRQREARDALENLRGEYAAYVRGAAISIPVSGPPLKVTAFASIAESDCHVVVADACTLYEELARDVEPLLGDRREFSGTHLGQLVRSMTEVGKDLDVWRITAPQIEDVVQVRDFAALVSLIRKLVRAADGDRLNLRRLERRAVEQGLLARYSAPTFAVLVVGGDAEEVVSLGLALFAGQSYPIELADDGKGVEVADVVAALNGVKKQVKSKK